MDFRRRIWWGKVSDVLKKRWTPSGNSKEKAQVRKTVASILARCTEWTTSFEAGANSQLEQVGDPIIRAGVIDMGHGPMSKGHFLLELENG